MTIRRGAVLVCGLLVSVVTLRATVELDRDHLVAGCRDERTTLGGVRRPRGRPALEPCGAARELLEQSCGEQLATKFRSLRRGLPARGVPDRQRRVEGQQRLVGSVRHGDRIGGWGAEVQKAGR